jgi:4-diphosphocytidyl-2-C-methyl-D-erythritol kinase
MRPSYSLISLRAPAKINLILHVLGRLPDGYHRIASLMQMVSLYDHLEIRKTPARKGIRFSVSGLPAPPGEDNLVIKAAQAYFERFQLKGGLEIKLHKQIPISAGLGGGSSDAAATLAALGRLWPFALSRAELITLARSIGSDVPFFLFGPTALIEATGEEIHPVRLAGEGWVVLVNPGLPISTAAVYQQLDQTRSEQSVTEPLLNKKIGLTLVENQHKITFRSAFQFAKLPPYLYNDLERIVLKTHPVIGVIKEQLRRLGAKGVLMSGSGPTVFGLFLQPVAARRAARVLSRAEKDWKVWVARILRRKPF